VVAPSPAWGSGRAKPSGESGSASSGGGCRGDEAQAAGPRAELTAEKRRLHDKLKRYEKEFEMRHGRPVRTVEDIAVVQADYDRYKQLKVLLGER
jgi:hypothetical protein